MKRWDEDVGNSLLQQPLQLYELWPGVEELSVVRLTRKAKRITLPL